ncbi:MAG: toxin-antitoxin system YwqK family antitoxin [Opitutales bacterium]
MYLLFRKRFAILLLALAWLPTLVPDVRADTIILKDGTRLKDVSEVRDTGRVFVYVQSGRTQTVSAKRVLRIEDSKGTLLYEDVEKMVTEVRRANQPSLFSFLRNGRTVATGYWSHGGIFEFESGKAPNGSWTQYYDSGKVRRTFNVHDGQLNGVCKVYFDSGKLEREGTFENGRESGQSLLYYPSGELKGRSSYRNGQKDGLTELFYESGNKKSEMTFRAGLPHGQQRIFYESGALEVEVAFVKGVKQGAIKQYFESGKLRFEGVYRDGALDGEVIGYYESGRVKKRQHFDAGRVVHENALVPEGRAGPSRD